MNRCPARKFANFLHDFDILEGWIGLFSHYLFKNAINLPKNKMHYAINRRSFINFNYTNKVDTIEKIPHPKTIGKIKVTNNKINFFVPFDFDKTEALQRNRYFTPKPEKFEERAVKCPNGEYEIQLFVDDIFNKNQSIIKKYKEEIFKYDLDNIKIGATDKTVENQYKKFIEMSGVLKNKYPIKDMGTHIYYIKLND